MTRLILGMLIFTLLLIFCLRQLYRGLRTGSVTAFTGGKSALSMFECHRAERPLMFWHTIVWYVFGIGLTCCVIAFQLLGPYVWGETAPTITIVQPYPQNGLHMYWDPPERFVDPIAYTVFRQNESDAEDAQIGTADGGSGVGQYVDENVTPGTTYTYQVQALYDGFTTWVIGDKPTLSEPATGKAPAR